MATGEQIGLAKILATHLQIRGGAGGWLHDRTGKSVCQGWDEFWRLAVRRSWIRQHTTGTWINSRVFCSGWRIDWRVVG